MSGKNCLRITQSALRVVLLLSIAATAAHQSSHAASAAEDKIVFDPRVTAIAGLPHGPFVRLADGGILGVRENAAIVTHDDGKIWQARPIFASPDGEKSRMSPFLVCLGDSTTAPREGVVIYADLLREGLSGRGIALWVENSGVGSSHTDHARERFQRDVLEHRPKLAIIQFGINDSAVDVWRNPPAAKPRVALARYEENLNFFIDTLRERKCEVILMTPNPLRWVEKTRQLYGRPPYKPDDADGFNVLLKDYAAAVRKIAAAKKVELIDVYALFESYDRQAGKSMDDLLLDGMHPNSTGHRLVADLLLEQIPRLLKSRAGGE